ncbi:hypothetical protein ACGFYQ_31755 [Streptomyces sp. NPDC048258]|uniref:hypothetical protein n=1 Tax=Streptomyces sp. NPDC048258 TaxID=3365527 RepID=UPI0037131CFE
MFWRRLGEPARPAGKNPFTPVESTGEPMAPMELAPPEPWDPSLPVARLPVKNGGDRELELVLEPYCWSEWLEPGQEVTVIAVGTADEERPWWGTTVPDEPFQVEYYPDQLVVWVNGDPLIVDSAGNELYRGF